MTEQRGDADENDFLESDQHAGRRVDRLLASLIEAEDLSEEARAVLQDLRERGEDLKDADTEELSDILVEVVS